MKTRRIIPVLFLALALLLPGCGKRPDGETLALMEASDAVCLVGWQGIYSRGDWMILRCRVAEDYLGNISTRGHDLNYYDRVIVYVAVDADWYAAVLEEHRTQRLILFLDLLEEDYPDEDWNDSGLWDLFVPHGGEGSIRWEGEDGAALRYLEALRAYGKKHPRGVESWTFQYPEGIWYGTSPF